MNRDLGQVFTPDNIINKMFSLRENKGSALEPSAGDGAFFKKLGDGAVGIEIDPSVACSGLKIMDFFDYSTNNKFDTIIGNPPYLPYNKINKETLNKINKSFFDKRTNLAIFFVAKCIEHLNEGGELIMIVPRNIFNSKAMERFNKESSFLSEGGFTHIEDVGDMAFKNASPNCIIFRYQKGYKKNTLKDGRELMMNDGQIYIIESEPKYTIGSFFYVKVGAASGANTIFMKDEEGAIDFVTSKTERTGKTEKMIMVNKPTNYLLKHKETLINRKIKKFDETNWWEFGRYHHKSDERRIYVNCFTRNPKPFFLHDCKNYDGSVLALIPIPRKDIEIDLEKAVVFLNEMDWERLGFKSGGRYIFTQRMLQNCPIPNTEKFVKWKI